MAKVKFSLMDALLVILGVEVAGVLIIMLSFAAGYGPARTGKLSVAQPAAEVSQPTGPKILNLPDVKGILIAFPADFPLEAGAKIDQAYAYFPQGSSNQLQATMRYATKKTVAQNKAVFTKYFATAGYQVINKVETAASLFYYATRGNNDLSVQVAKTRGQLYVTASNLLRK